MKKKLFYLFSFAIIFVAAICVYNPVKVEAADSNCKVYTNYYLLAEVLNVAYADLYKDNNYYLTRSKFFPGLPEGATDVDGNAIGKSDGVLYDNILDPNNNTDLDTLEKFYTMFKSTEEKNGVLKDANDASVTYYTNLNWNDEAGAPHESLNIGEVSSLVNSTLVPSYTVLGSVETETKTVGEQEVKFAVINNNNLSRSSDGTSIGMGENNVVIQLTRVLKAGSVTALDADTHKLTYNSKEYTPISYEYNAVGGGTANWYGLHEPAMFVLKYQLCSKDTSKTETTDPTLTINYWYSEKDKEVAADSYIEVIPEGKKYEVESPKIDGYTADIEVVRGTMPGEDRIVNVIYTPKTGELAMGLIWFIGLAGLGYGIYYYNKVNKEDELEEEV